MSVHAVKMADQRTRDLLIEWGFEAFLHNFQDEEIDIAALLLLDSETIDKLITKAGPKLKFKEKLKTLLQPSDDYLTCENNDTTEHDSDLTSTCVKHKAVEALNRKLIIENNCNVSSNNTANCNIDLKKILKSKTPTILTKLQNGESITILEKHQINRVFVCVFTETFGAYPSAGKKIEFASHIVQSFPSLKGAGGTGYEQWFCRGTKNKHASGLIEDRLKNWRKSLCPGDKQSFGVGEQRAKQLILNKPRFLSVDQCLSENDISEEDYLEFKQWLKETSQPRALVQQYMAQTCHRRQVEIQSALSDENKSIHDILVQWPKLKEWCYIDLEFRNLYKSERNDFEEEFLSVSNDILRSTVNCGIKAAELYFTTLDLNRFSDVKYAQSAAVSLLPYLLPQGIISVKDSKGKQLKLRLQSNCSLKHFIDCVPVGTDIEHFVDSNNTSVRTLQGTRKQPFILVVGDSILDEHQCFVICENNAINVQSVVHGVDICYKLTYIFNVEFSPYCRNVWDYIDKYVYNMQNSNSDVAGCVRELSVRIKNLIRT